MEQEDRFIRLSDVPRLKWMPINCRSKRLHISTIFRWAQIGISGIRLQTAQIGGARCTTETWLHEFFEHLDNPQAGDAPTSVQVHRQHEQAEHQLAAAGI